MVKLRGSLIVWALVLLVGFCHSTPVVAATSPVDDMMNRLPDEVIAFSAGSGCEHLGPAFEKSIIGRIWNDPETKSFYQAVKGSVTAKMSQEGDPAAGILNDVLEIAQLALARPVVIGVAKNDSAKHVGAYGFLILDAGEKKDKVTTAVSKLEARVPQGEMVDVRIGSYNMHGPKEPEDVPGYWGWVGNYFVFAINDGQGLAVKYLQSPRSGSSYLSNVPNAGDAMAMFIDFPKIMNLVKQLVAQEAEAEMAGKIMTAIGELGLNSLKNIKVRADFDGGDVVADELVEVEGARSGIFACMRPMDISLFDVVDARAVSAGATNIDVALISEAYMKMIKAVLPEDALAEMDEAISGFETDANVNLCADIVNNLAGPIVSYAMPMGAVMEAPAGGFAVVAELNDAKAFEKAMTSIGQYASAKSNGMLQVSAQAKGDGTVVHTWAIAPLMMAQIMPTWAVVDNKFILASNTNLQTLAAKQVVSKEKKKTSLSGTEVFKKITADVPKNLVSFNFTDSQSQFKQLLMTAQQFWPMATMMATQQGVQLPMMLPTYSNIIKDMGPTVSYSWWDSKGLRSRYKGSGIEASAGIAGAAVGMGVMMPALARARSVSSRVVSGTNISGLVKASLVYANDDDQGRFPSNLEKLVEHDYTSPKQLESPLKPKGFSGPSYIYIVGQTPAMEPGNILIYENPAYCGECVNAGFIDAHVKCLPREEFLQALAETYKRLGREMPEIKFKD